MPHTFLFRILQQVTEQTVPMHYTNDITFAFTSTGVLEITVGNSAGLSTLRFSNLTYNVDLSESSRTGTVLTTVQARLTSGSGTVTYSFANGNEERTFSINSKTGRCCDSIDVIPSLVQNMPERLFPGFHFWFYEGKCKIGFETCRTFWNMFIKKKISFLLSCRKLVYLSKVKAPRI